MSLDLENLINDIGSSRRQRRESAQASASQQLKKWWVAERMAPILLEYQEDLVVKVVAQVRSLIAHIEETSLMLMEDEPNSNADATSDVKVQLLIVETELERVRFIVRAYKRTRIAKIDQHPYFYLQQQQEGEGLMSKDEWIYCHRHTELIADHQLQSFLGSLPKELQDLTDNSGSVPMIESPDLEKPVVIRVTRDVPNDAVLNVGNEEFQLERGGIYLLRYSAIASLREYVEII